jgi:nucleoid-associated protein EbfC
MTGRLVAGNGFASLWLDGALAGSALVREDDPERLARRLAGVLSPERRTLGALREGATVSEGGQPDISALLAQAQRMQEQLLAAREDLASAVVEGSAASGLVTARVNGTGDLVGLNIDPEAVDPDDTETLADMIIAAIRDANDNAQALVSERLGGVTGQLATGLPGDPPDEPPTRPIGF